MTKFLRMLSKREDLECQKKATTRRQRLIAKALRYNAQVSSALDHSWVLPLANFCYSRDALGIAKAISSLPNISTPADMMHVRLAFGPLTVENGVLG